MRLMYSATACLLCLLIGISSGATYASREIPGAHAERDRAIANEVVCQQAAETAFDLALTATGQSLRMAELMGAPVYAPDVPVRNVNYEERGTQ